MEVLVSQVEPINRKERRAYAANGEDAVLALRGVLPAGCDPAFDTGQASTYTGLAEATLEGYRTRGGGPRDRKSVV